MTDRVRQMAPIIWEEINKANRILLHCHPSTDPDSTGGALACYHVLKNLSKELTVIAGDNVTPDFLKALPGADKIVQKNYFEIDPNQFDLFLILDSSNKSQVSKKGEVIFPENLRTVVIDHHTNDGYANINLVDTSYPAVCQILFELFREWQLVITPEAAACLYAGLYGDTGGFKYFPTASDTLLAASELAKIYPDFPKLIFEIENSNSPDMVKFMGIVFSHIETYFQNQVALAIAPFEELQKNKIDNKKVIKGDVANALKSVVGWDIAVCVTEVTPDKTEFNFRGRKQEKYDVGEIARQLGGGGHRAAAGAPVLKPLNEAKKLLLETIQKVYPELGSP